MSEVARSRDDAPPALAAVAAGLARSCHPGPTVAVTALASLLAASRDLDAGRVALVAAAVLTGQLSIGWGNDLLDRHRDHAVGRTDKPLATGELPVPVARTAVALAVAATVALSLACGIVAGLVHLGCVAAGWAYDLGVKATSWSWLPYATAFGGLPVFVVLAAPGVAAPPWWLPLGGALLGVGAHLLNALPDLDDDLATGVRGLPHRLGGRRSAVAAVVALLVATLVIALGAAGAAPWLRVAVLTAAAALAVVTLTTHGRTPFRAAIGIAALAVVLLVMAP
ncbi:UbiA family prenyltransferase [Nocardioides nanhaiensis]|uniref:UbiA family prenyltransferase n=1 Tax=Nocardioides nanhaiensis TaxID=1476871 RepID=A0ABP8WB89_9ACTN